jgi:hypothetical protein
LVFFNDPVNENQSARCTKAARRDISHETAGAVVGQEE